MPHLVEVHHLVKQFTRREGFFTRPSIVHAVNDVSFSVDDGETFGLVGESGSGKTTTGRCILRLVEPTSGEVRFRGENVLAFSHEDMRRARQQMQIVFQDPYSSLNPRMRVREIIEEPLIIHKIGTRDSRAERVRELYDLVGLDPDVSSAVPSLGPSLVLAVRTVLEPAAIALDNAIALQKAEALSVTDDLTRLYNSRYLNRALRRETKRASRNGRPLSLLFLDLDGFKMVNDNHGHLAGSKALAETATIVRGCARETDVVARFGGDEFALILPDTGQEGAVAVATRIRDRVGAAQFLAEEGLSLHLTVSVGVATLPDSVGSAEELLRAADAAMYQVKASGKNGIHVFASKEL